AREREKFPVVLLDEYQDTSVSQAILLAALFSGPPDAGLGHAVMAVGDPNQAIYGWRGASVSNILHFERSFPGIGGEVPVYSLSVNQRSDQRILETANALAKPLLARAAQVPPLEAAPGRKNGTIRVNVFASLEQELDWVAAEVKRAHTTAWSDIGVLVRDNQTAATTYDHLTALGIPVEIVGLSGLLRLPEIAEVVATMQLLQSVTANSAVLTLLTGPRWSIGPRDLHLLAQRAQELAGSPIRREVLTPEQQLARIAAGQDETELPALTDALDDPGAGSYSAAALLAFGQLSTQLRRLRRLAGEPVADVVRWIIEITGVDVELASSNNPAAAARRDNLDHFLRVVSEFRGLDGEVTMAAVLAYLSAEDELGKGLELATPTAADSVKLLTMHRAKGLEWKSVFLVGVCETRFPSNQTRPTWVAAPAVIPAPLRGDAADLPQLAGYDKTALDDYRSRVRAHEQLEELRLAYVAVTRPEHDLVVTSHLWDPAVRTPRGPSSYQQTIKELLESWGEPVAGWAERPDPKVTPNPLLGQEPVHFWPTRSQGQEAASRAEAAALVAGVGVNQADAGLTTAEQELVAAWDRDLTRLLGQARQETSPVEVALPSSLSVTALGRLRADPQAFRDELIRPMPRPPSRGARFGSSFHEWVAHRFQQRDLFDPSDVLEPRDLDLITGTELQELIAAFEAGPFADREPIAVEAPFSLLLDGMVIRGRIDAVYPAGAEPGQYLVVDWKTGSPDGADPIQLAVYRLAWAELAGVGLEQISACFHFPRSGQTIQHPDLPGRAELSRILRSVEN
ncbi:MAG TPA: ATP-dependent DNA helicase, partial [Marmoricola sp.]|nr:ATP-dependent DNA helicase [Marmoricola sp.]